MRTGRLYGRECDLIEAGLNEAAGGWRVLATAPNTPTRAREGCFRFSKHCEDLMRPFLYVRDVDLDLLEEAARRCGGRVMCGTCENMRKRAISAF